MSEIQLVPTGGRNRTREVNDTVRGFSDLRGDCEYILWTLEGADVRVTLDGGITLPAAGGPGHLFTDGATGVWRIEVADAARFTKEGATNATFRITQLREGA